MLELDHSDFKIVRIEWLDSCQAVSGWAELDNLDLSIPTMITVGFVIRQNLEVVAVATSLGRYHVGTVTVIPKCSIKRIEYINVT